MAKVKEKPEEVPAGGSETPPVGVAPPSERLVIEDDVREILEGESREFPEPVPGMEVEIREERALAQAPAASLPSEREWAATIAVAREIARTPFVPQDYRGQPEAVVAAILTGRELGIGPMQSLRDIYMVDGRPVFSASLMLAQMRRKGLRILESVSTSERAWIRAQRADTEEIAEVEWTFEEASLIDAKPGKKLIEKANWKNYPADMLWARCVGRLARRLGSDLLAGMVYAAEELRDLEGFDGSGYAEGTAIQPVAVAWEDLDPGAVMHPDAPKGWKEILDAFEAVDPGRNWRWFVQGILTGKYWVERPQDLGDDYQDAGRRMANLAGYLQFVVMEGKEFPPPSDEDLVSAVQWAFDGLTIEIIDPPEEGEVVEPEESHAALSAEETAAMAGAIEVEVEFGDDPVAEEVRDAAERDPDPE